MRRKLREPAAPSKEPSKPIEPINGSEVVRVTKSSLELAWQLLHTREWPISMMMDLAAVKLAFHEAVEGKVPNEVKGTHQD